MDPAYPPPTEEAASIKVVEEAVPGLKTILRKRGSPARRPGLVVSFDLHEQELDEEPGNKRAGKAGARVPTQPSL